MRSQEQSVWSTLPIVSLFISEWHVWRKEMATPGEKLAPRQYDGTNLLPYPLDIVTELSVPHGALDEVGVPYNEPTVTYPAIYQATTIAQYALIHWNRYLATGDDKHRQAFMTQAHWLVDHETRLVHDAGGWPIPFPLPAYHASRSWLSALTQGNGISVLVRAYQLTGEESFLRVARRAVHIFELDILDGGVRTSVGEHGVFFEEVAVYPAAHILNGYLFGLFGLYDYVAVIGNESISELIERSKATLHALLNEFDTGYWSRYDLLKRQLASHYYHDLHILLLQALARYSHCEHCAKLAAKWQTYQHNRFCRLRYFIVSRATRYLRAFQRVFKVGARFIAPHGEGRRGIPRMGDVTPPLSLPMGRDKSGPYR